MPADKTPNAKRPGRSFWIAGLLVGVTAGVIAAVALSSA